MWPYLRLQGLSQDCIYEGVKCATITESPIDSMKSAIKVILSFGILAALLWRMEWSELESLIAHIKPSAWAYAMAMVILQSLFLAYRWMVLINIGRKHMTFVNAVQVTMVSFMANIVFLTAISGVVVRIAMAVQYGSSLFKAFFATAIDRAMTLIALVIFSALFLPALGGYFDKNMHTDLTIYLIALMILIFVLMPALLYTLFKNMDRLPLSLRNVRTAQRYIKILITSPSVLTKVILSSLLGQICLFISIYLICLSANIGISFIDLMTVLPIITLVASLPFSVGGWGLREGAFVFGLGILGVPMEEAFLISVQIGLIGILATVLIGLPAAMTADFDKIGHHSKLVFASLKDRLR